MARITELVHRRQLCAGVAVALPAHVAGEAVLDERAAHHVAQCLRCQAEVVRYRRMLRTLHDLRNDAPAPPSTAVSDIISQLGRADRIGRTRLGPVAVVALVTGAAGGAGTLLWLSRRDIVGPAVTRPGFPRPGFTRAGFTRAGFTRHRMVPAGAGLQEMVIRLLTRRATTNAITTV